nr:hypothetical protein [Roseovarius salinarum]
MDHAIAVRDSCRNASARGRTCLPAARLLADLARLYVCDAGVERNHLPVNATGVCGIEIDLAMLEPVRRRYDVSGAPTDPLEPLDEQGIDAAPRDVILHL